MALLTTSDTKETPLANLAAAQTACRLRIERLIEQIDSVEVRKIIDTLFKNLLRSLECMSLLDNHLRHVDAAEQTFFLIQLIQADARALVEFIEGEALNPDLIDQQLFEVLDGITFAVKLDLKRLVDIDPGQSTADKTPHVVLSKLYRAHHILTNCLQQSTITLGMVFDSEFTGASLFNNSDLRYRQSLQLCQDLTELIQFVENCEEKRVESAFSRMIESIEKFRYESLEYLMYSDWSQFENFCERIASARGVLSEAGSVLHEFRCYLETLLNQVRMRAVLINVPPIQLEANDGCQNKTGGMKAPHRLPPHSPSSMKLKTSAHSQWRYDCE
ncbi:MAG: hypothetical protein ABR557_09950 [Pyrinomonadaceae bacterium]